MTFSNSTTPNAHNATSSLSSSSRPSSVPSSQTSTSSAISTISSTSSVLTSPTSSILSTSGSQVPGSGSKSAPTTNGTSSALPNPSTSGNGTASIATKLPSSSNGTSIPSTTRPGNVSTTTTAPGNHTTPACCFLVQDTVSEEWWNVFSYNSTASVVNLTSYTTYITVLPNTTTSRVETHVYTTNHSFTFSTAIGANPIALLSNGAPGPVEVTHTHNGTAVVTAGITMWVSKSSSQHVT